MTIFFHPRYLDHKQYGSHPECPERLSTIMAKLEECHLTEDISKPDGPAEVATVERIHEKSYIEMLQSFGEGFLDPDTYNREDTYDIAMLAARGGVLAADHGYELRKPSIALVRPPGHHAGADYYGGFCYFNNIAIAAQYLLDKKKVEKVAIVDYDVHHGNGTEDIFFKRKDVLYISTHQWGIYPGTGHYEHVGEDDGEGFTVNIPFLHTTGDSSYKLAYKTIIKPILTQYAPDMILISLGTDGHYQDPIATLTLSTPGYIWLVRETWKLAGELCEGRMAVLLEGGYHQGALAEIIAGIVAEFYERPKSVETKYNHSSDINKFGADVIEKVKMVQSRHWKLD